jgi:hypothetical protein
MDDPVRVWRVVTCCFGDTNLNAFHDQILAPAMGWRRHFHAYRYVIPTNGASIFPQDTDAMDRNHLVFTSPTFSLDCKDYDVRYFLRAKGDRLIYLYGMGDNWCDTIKVLDIVDKGTKLSGATFKDLDEQVFQAIPRPSSKEWLLTRASLLWGKINCPPQKTH